MIVSVRRGAENMLRMPSRTPSNTASQII